MLLLSAGPQPHEPEGLWFGLFPFRSPLLGDSLLFSFPPVTSMFQFTGLSLLSGSTAAVSVDTGLPHSDVHESLPACGSSWLFAACHVLLRRLTPRHPPYALGSLTCFSKGHLSMSWFFPFFLDPEMSSGRISFVYTVSCPR